MKLLRTLALLLVPSLLFAASGDIKISYKASNNTTWIDAIFGKQNNALLGTDSNGIPRIATGPLFVASSQVSPSGTPSLTLYGSSNTERFEIQSYGSGSPLFQGIFGGGTSSSPTQTLSGNILGGFGGGGFDNAATPLRHGNTGLVYFGSTENFTASSLGTELIMQVTPNGSATRVTAGRLSADGLSITNGLFRVTADVVSTTTGLVDITGLTGFAVVAGNTYSVRIWLPIQASSTGGWNVKINGTATVSSLRGVGRLMSGPVSAPVTKFSTLAALNAGPSFASAGPEGGEIEINMTFTAATSGTIVPQFAQNNTAGNSTINAGGYMWAQRY